MPRCTSSVSPAEAEQQVLAAPVERVDGAARRAASARSAGTGQRKRGSYTLHRRDPAADDMRSEAAARGFDFGEFRHRRRSGCALVVGPSRSVARPRLLRRRIYPKMHRLILPAAPAGPASSPVPPRPANRFRISTMRRLSVRCFRPRPLAAAVCVRICCRSRRRRCARSAQSDALAGADPHARRVDPPGADQAVDGLTAELMYRLLIGDIALQRGEPALAARAYFEAAREAKDPTLARRATEIGLAARQRGVDARSGPAVERARSDRGAPEAGDRDARRGAARGKSADVVDSDLKAQIEQALAAGRRVTPRARRRVPAAQPAAGAGAGQERHLQARRRAREAVSERCRKRISPSRWPRSTPASRSIGMLAAATQRGRSRARAEARLGARACCSSRRSSARIRRPRPSTTSTAFLKADPDLARRRAGALAQLYVEQKRYADARAIFQRLWDQDKTAREFEFGIAALSVQMKDWATAEKRAAGPEARELRRERRRRALSRADRRGIRQRYDLAIERYRARARRRARVAWPSCASRR